MRLEAEIGPAVEGHVPGSSPDAAISASSTRFSTLDSPHGSRAARNAKAHVRLRSDPEAAREEVALLQKEIEIKDRSRWTKIGKPACTRSPVLARNCPLELHVRFHGGRTIP
jgi:hypothetical protein